MGIKLTDGLTVNSQAQGDDRFSFPTVKAALEDGWTATIAGIPVAIGRLSMGRRYEGLAVWIQEENKQYRFIGGITNDHFIPDVGGSGGGVLTEALTATVSAFGIKAGETFSPGTDTADVLKQMLSPAQAPAISAFACTPPFGLYEVGETLSTFRLSATVVKKTNPIALAEMVNASTGTVLLSDDTIPSGGELTYIDSEGMSSGLRTYRVDSEDSKGLKTSHAGSIEFVYPALVGSVASPSPAAANLLVLQHLVMKKASFTHAYTQEGQYMGAAFPASWGVPIAIRDQNGFDISRNFNLLPIQIAVLFGAHSEQYNVLVYRNQSTATVTFDF